MSLLQYLIETANKNETKAVTRTKNNKINQEKILLNDIVWENILINIAEDGYRGLRLIIKPLNIYVSVLHKLVTKLTELLGDDPNLNNVHYLQTENVLFVLFDDNYKVGQYYAGLYSLNSNHVYLKDINLKDLIEESSNLT